MGVRSPAYRSPVAVYRLEILADAQVDGYGNGYGHAINGSKTRIAGESRGFSPEHRIPDGRLLRTPPPRF